MKSNYDNIPAGRMIIMLMVMINTVILKLAYINNPGWYWGLVLFVPLLFIGFKRYQADKKTQRHKTSLIG